MEPETKKITIQFSIESAIYKVEFGPRKSVFRVLKLEDVGEVSDCWIPVSRKLGIRDRVIQTAIDLLYQF